jgi:hypothetical protein
MRHEQAERGVEQRDVDALSSSRLLAGGKR